MNNTKGFSLVELLVAVLIGLLAIVAATTAMQRFETSRRSALGTSDSMKNGFLALLAIQSDAAKAGWGMNDASLLGCPTLMTDNLLVDTVSAYPLGSNGLPQPLAPASIINVSNPSPDVVSFYSGSSNTGTASVALSQSYSGDVSPLSVSKVEGTFYPGDVYVVAPPASQAGRVCLIGQVSSLDKVNNPKRIFHVNGAIAGTALSTRYSGATSVAAYDASARVYNLGPGDSRLNRGPAPSFRRWFVQNGNLMIRASDVLSNNQVQDTVVADNIVSLKAQYGLTVAAGTVWSSTMIDADADGVIGDAGDWQRLSSVRVAVVARSREVDKPDGSGKCTTTTTKSRVFDLDGSGFEVDIEVAGDIMDWTCYRYRVFEAVVPLRNSIWRPQ